MSSVYSRCQWMCELCITLNANFLQAQGRPELWRFLDLEKQAPSYYISFMFDPLQNHQVFEVKELMSFIKVIQLIWAVEITDAHLLRETVLGSRYLFLGSQKETNSLNSDNKMQPTIHWNIGRITKWHSWSTDGSTISWLKSTSL